MVVCIDLVMSEDLFMFIGDCTSSELPVHLCLLDI